MNLAGEPQQPRRLVRGNFPVTPGPESPYCDPWLAGSRLDAKLSRVEAGNEECQVRRGRSGFADSAW